MRLNVLLRGENFVFETKTGLFSKDRVDDGTRLLIEKMQINPTNTILDLGCGWGPIGISAAKLAYRGKVYMIDTDIRAIKYSLINTKLDNIKNIDIRLSDGFENLGKIKFDVICSNPPSHSANETLIEFMEGSQKQLKNKGKLYLVVEKRISSLIKRELKQVFNNYEVLYVSPKHTLFLCSNDSNQ